MKRTCAVFALAILVAAPVSAQPVDSYLADFRSASPGSSSPNAAYFDRALSDAELESLFRVGNLDAETRPGVWKTFPGELLVALHIRLRHAGGASDGYFNEVDYGTEELKLDARNRSGVLRFLSNSLTIALLNRDLTLKEGKAARAYINRSGYGSADNLVIDLLYGQPSYRRWIEKENGTKGRGEASKLNDVVARGAWIGLHPKTLQGPWNHFNDLITKLNLPAGSTIADMGTAYGRFGFVVGQHFPKLNFVGYEYLEHRVAPSQKAAAELGFSNVRFVQADFSARDFKPVQADVFFTYWSNGQREVMEGLFDRLLEIAIEKPWIRIVTREFNPQQAMRGAEPWLVAEGEPIEIKKSKGGRVPYLVYKTDPDALRRAAARLASERRAKAEDERREKSERRAETSKELLRLPAPKEVLRLPAPSPVEAKIDRLAEFRRADGTLRWKPLLASRALGEAGGLAQFGLALFLKEVAVVAVSGDRARIDEFFDGLLGTDFYTHYGLFVAGARLTEIGYTKYLQRFVKPRFVNGLLKTNLVLAAGLALPMIYEGKLTGRTLAISLGSLGLSATAVKSGVASLKWVTSIEAAKQRGLLARLSGTKLAKFGGWFYTALELAVVLYIAEPLDRMANDYLDAKAAREALAKAGADLVRALEGGADVAGATAAHHEAWIDYRNFLYHPLQYDEVIFAGRLEGLARKAKLLSDERQAALSRIHQRAFLAKSLKKRHGSVEAFAAARASRDERKIQAKADLYLESYNSSREKHLIEVYADNLRGTLLLDGVTPLKLRNSEDPFATRIAKDVSRSRTAHELKAAYLQVSLNRREAYDDEAEALAFFAAALRGAGRDSDAQIVDAKRSVVLGLKQADDELREGQLTIPAPVTPRSGLVEAVESR